MVNPGTFQGKRKEFLLSQKAYYCSSVSGGYAKDAVAIIQRRFFKRFPIELPLEEEPSDETLAAVDDEAPEEDEEIIVDPDLSPDEQQTQVEQRAERAKQVEKRKGQISRWLAYQYMKDNDADPKDSGTLSPNRILLFKLTGKGVDKPRQKTPSNLWRKTQRERIEAQAKSEHESTKLAGRKPQNLIVIRDKLAREGFARLSEEEKSRWTIKAKEEHRAALKQFELDTTQPPSTAPEDRQRCIQGLTAFVQPILDLICEATGWKASFIAGGPEPAKGGHLNILSVHSGETKGDIKMNFGHAERVRYKKYFVSTYGSFLKMCYTPEECRERALPVETVFEPLSAEDLDHAGVNLDSVAWNSSTVPVGTTTSTPSNDGSPGEDTTTPLNVDNDRSASQTTSNIGNSNAICHESSASADLQPSRSSSRIPPPSPPPPPTPPRQPTPDRASTPGLGHFNAHFAVPGSPPISFGSPPSPPSPTLEPVSPTRHPISPPRHLEPMARPNHTDAGASVAAKSKSLKRPIDDTSVSAGSSGHDEDLLANREHQPLAKRARHEDLVGVSSTTNPSPSSTSDPSSSSANPLPLDTAAPPQVPTATSHPKASDVEVPDWFIDAHKMLSAKNFGPLWTDLIGAWRLFEEHEGFVATNYLKAKHRPAQIGLWVKNYRKSTWRQDITNVAQYAESLTTWWASLQPSWRLAGEHIDYHRVEGDWSVLRRSGVNGLLNVLVGLLFWAEKLDGSEFESGEWVDVVKDVTRACSCLLSPCE